MPSFKADEILIGAEIRHSVINLSSSFLHNSYSETRMLSFVMVRFCQALPPPSYTGRVR